MTETKDLVVQQREYLTKTFEGTTFKNALAQISKVFDLHGFDPRRLIEVSIFEFSKSDEMIKASPISKIRAVLEAAKMGLEPDGRLGYMIPQKRKGVQEVKFMASYLGEIEAVRRICPVLRFPVAIVRENDFFEYEPSDEDNPIRHKILARSEEARGEKYAVWAKVRLIDGSLYERVLFTADIERAKKSAYLDGLMWTEHEDEAWMKTVVRRVAKKLPRTKRVPFPWEAPVDVDQLIGAKPQEEAEVIDIGTAKSRSEELEEQLSAGSGFAEGSDQGEGVPSPSPHADDGDLSPSEQASMDAYFKEKDAREKE